MAGQKLKTHKGVKKRFRKTGTGKLMHYPANKRHILTSKRRNRKRKLSAPTRVAPGDAYRIHALKQAGVGLDRKVLSNMAIADPGGFTRLVDTAKAQMDTAKAQMDTAKAQMAKA